MKFMLTKRIAFIIVYMGKLPDFFYLWNGSLADCDNKIDFYIFTDDEDDYSTVDNVKIINISFEMVKCRMQKLFDFPIVLETAYKLCDYKVAYGEAFEDYLQEYDYWGFCDLDLIWGDITSFINDELLSPYDRIGFGGHLSIFRNDPKVNSYYRTLPNLGYEDYRLVYSSNDNFAYDEFGEHAGGGTSFIFIENGIPTNGITEFADMAPYMGSFIDNKNGRKKAKFVCHQENGKLIVQYSHGERKEILYAHFQKRKLSLFDTDINRTYYITPPNVIRNYISRMTVQNLIYVLYLDVRHRVAEFVYGKLKLIQMEK